MLIPGSDARRTEKAANENLSALPRHFPRCAPGKGLPAAQRQAAWLQRAVPMGRDKLPESGRGRKTAIHRVPRAGSCGWQQNGCHGSVSACAGRPSIRSAPRQGGVGSALRGVTVVRRAVPRDYRWHTRGNAGQ